MHIDCPQVSFVTGIQLFFQKFAHGYTSLPVCITDPLSGQKTSNKLKPSKKLSIVCTPSNLLAAGKESSPPSDFNY